MGGRDPDGRLSCVVAFGSAAWDLLFGLPRPSELHPFRELRAGAHHAPATEGDILLHIGAERFDLCYELAAQIMARLGGCVETLDETYGFRYFDVRDLTGFVDGTENPQGLARLAAGVVGAEDPAFSGGSYVMVQKYVHDLVAWDRVPTEVQEQIIGRTKLSDVELEDGGKPSHAHNALTTLVEGGQEIKIVRHNTPFGNVSGSDAGTYFIGYVRSSHPLEAMLEAMVVGRPPGNYDRLLDFTHPVSGTNFFAPSLQFLSTLGSDQAPEPLPPAAAVARARAHSSAGALHVGSLKGAPRYE